jgi:hypothetical protein
MFPPRCLILALVVALSLPAASGRAAGMERDMERDIALCESAIVRGARAGGVPQEVLHAISLTETGRRIGGKLRPWPWAINREGRGHWFATRAEALDFARQSVAEGRHSFDVGCFQINYHWHGHNFPSLESMFDPDVSAAYAARFLGELLMEKGDWQAAAGAYHSRTPQFANAYRQRFSNILAGLGGSALVETVAEAAPEADATPRKSRTRLARRPLIITLPRAQPEDGTPPALAAREDVTLPRVWTPASGVRRGL